MTEYIQYDSKNFSQSKFLLIHIIGVTIVISYYIVKM
jgi:hypothetical protein